MVLGKFTLRLLNELIAASDNIAEFRRAKETADFWASIDNAEQAEWAENLAARLSVAPGSSVNACILDSGVNNGHPILAPIIPDAIVLVRNCFDPD